MPCGVLNSLNQGSTYPSNYSSQLKRLGYDMTFLAQADIRSCIMQRCKELDSCEDGVSYSRGRICTGGNVSAQLVATQSSISLFRIFPVQSHVPFPLPFPSAMCICGMLLRKSCHAPASSPPAQCHLVASRYSQGRCRSSGAGKTRASPGTRFLRPTRSRSRQPT